MKKFLIVLLGVILILTGCADKKKGKPIPPTVSHPPPYVEKPIYNVYLENSGSMDGYVKGVTHFEQTLYQYLSDISISGLGCNLNLFYVNSQIIPQGTNIGNFIQNLEPTTFKAKGGERGSTDILNVLTTVLSETSRNEVAIVITDGLISPGKGINASEYLVNQQIGIKEMMARYRKVYPNTSVVLYQLTSQFDGYYYNREGARTQERTLRPYYIWLIGDIKHIDKLYHLGQNGRFNTGSVKNVFSISAGNRKVDYAVKIGSGKFSLDRMNPKTTIINLKKDTKGKNNSVRFSVNANFSGFLLDDKYLLNVANYKISNNEFKLIVEKAGNKNYTHLLNFSSSNVHKGKLAIKLITNIPQWIENTNDPDGIAPIIGKTFGIKNQVQGIFDAFTFGTGNDFYTQIIINIK